MGFKSLVAWSDSQLVISQVNGAYETKVPCLNKYVEKVKGPLENFNHFQLERILWWENDHVDTLAKLASMRMPSAFIQLVKLSLQLKWVSPCVLIRRIVGWILSRCTGRMRALLKDKRQAKKIKKRSSLYYMENDQLHK